MASRQHSKSKKTRNSIPCFSKRSDWAAYMAGADPEWLGSREALSLAQVFGAYFPAWLIESEPWRPVTALRFQIMRKDLMELTVEQCAAYLQVHAATVRRWESGEVQVPRAAYETLRLQYYSASQRLSHKCWDGWFINRKTGELISPDHGRLAVKPEEIKGLPVLYKRLSILEQNIAVQCDQISALEAENAALRQSGVVHQVAAELEAMQERLAGLLGSVRTAEIIEFNKPADEVRRVATR